MDSLKNSLNHVLEQFDDQKNKTLNHFIPPKELEDILKLELNEDSLGSKGVESFLKDYVKYSVNTNHKLYLNQLWSKVQETSILGEFVSALTNTSMYTYEVAPVATLLEKKYIDDLTKMIWGEVTDGVMTSGGTASNMQAVLVARNIKFPEMKEKGIWGQRKRPILLTSETCHYSVKRAANIAGLGHENLIEVPVNNKGQMTAENLKTELEKLGPDDRPFCLISTAGSTVEGAYDDLCELAEVCKEYDIWFHVDGAYGASVLLSEKHKELMKGIEKCDSLSWDFHKMLGLNLPCAFIFTKEKHVLHRTLTSNNDSYLFHDSESYNLGVSSLQCGRRNDVLKLWLSWLNIGGKGFEQRVNKIFDLSQKFADLLENDDSFELLLRPQSINLCFRYRFKDGKRHESEVREKLIQDGKLMVNYSKYGDGTFFRMAITNPELEEKDLETIFSLIKSEAQAFDQTL